MDIYLDIDGTLIHEELTDKYGQPAHGLVEFLEAIKHHDLYWLTTHCRDGNPDKARSILKAVTSVTVHSIIDTIKGTVWDIQKTDGINFANDFVWIDNHIMDTERDLVSAGTPNQAIIEVNLVSNPLQLTELTYALQ